MNPASGKTGGWLDRWRSSWAMQGLGLGLLIVAAYLRAMDGDFLWDDDAHITANAVIVGPLGLKEIWTTAAANYFPLVLTNFWAQHALWGLNPVGYHLVTLAFHVGSALLLWRVLVTLRVPGAWLGAALWALHPVQVESVAWICELKNTQSAVFFLAALLYFLRWSAMMGGGLVAPGGMRAYALALGFALAAVLSKPSTVMLPVALVLGWWWQHRRFPWREAGWLVPFVGLSGLVAGWTIWEQKFHSGAIGPEWSQSWAERCIIAGKAVWFYLGKLAWPFELTFIYPRWSPDATSPLSYVPGVLAVTGLAWLWWRRDRWPAGFVAAFFFVGLLFPVLGFFSVYFFRYSFVGDHFQYLASMAPMAMVGAGLARLGSLRLRTALGGFLVGGLAVLTVLQCGEYLNREALWRATVSRNPQAAMAWVHLGDVLAQSNRKAEAMECFRRALALNPQHPEAHNHVAIEYLLQGKTEEGIAALERAIASRPKFPVARTNLGVTLMKQGRAKEALPHFESAIELWPASPEARVNLANALAAVGRTTEAITEYEVALKLDASYPGLRDHYGIALVEAGRSAEAVTQYEAALKAQPNDARVHRNLAIELRGLGRLPEALAHFEAAIRLEPNRAETHDDYGVALAAAGKTAEAVAQYQTALRLNPALASAHNDYGVVLAKTGQMEEALRRFDEALRLDANYVGALINRGRALAALGRVDEASAALARVVQLQPSSAAAHAFLGQLLRALGRDAEARTHLETATRLQAASAGKR